MKNLDALGRYRDNSPDVIAWMGDVDPRLSGVFHVPVYSCAPHFLKIIASAGEGWDHVSISLPNRCPTWPEMCLVKDMFFEDEEMVIQIHPKKSEYVNYHPYCLHMWRWQLEGQPMPPSILVGPKT